MNYRISLHLALLWVVLLPLSVFSRENVNSQRTTQKQFRTTAACLPATSSAQLNINNVRTLLHNGGDMWWDLVSNPRYEVPKVDDPSKAKHALFAGSLWIGGIDASGQLRIAAQTYRQSGNDFFPGPLRIDGTASTDDAVCKDFDRHFKVEKTEISAFLSAYPNVDATQFPSIYSWPASASKVSSNVDGSFANDLAPFVDKNNDGAYNPDDGDYPAIIGDQAIWWVLNDKGEVHSETRGEQIGVEIQTMAFAFATSNAVNNMTFYKYKVINRSTFKLNDTYIGQWVDADLGFYNDDYVGSDTCRGLGFAYNGNPVDQLPTGYGAKPPAIGVDFFQGPRADNAADLLSDSLDNNGNGIKDEPAEAFLKMAKFIYYDNDFSVRGNPTQASHYYGYLTGFWKNGSPVVDDRNGNGNGFPESGEINVPTNYMFPDYPGPGCAGLACQKASSGIWNEASAGNQPFDRRFIESAGPFTLQSGAVNEIVIGVVWARDENNAYDAEQFGSVCALLEADDIAQALFDSNFDLLDGPDAPDLAIEEFDKELILTWSYKNTSSNNVYENYSELDPILAPIASLTEERKRFDFEGYLVYQLLDGTVSASQLNDPAKSRLLLQCDVKNGITTIVNRSVTTLAGVSEPVITDQVMVEGKDKGLQHTLRVTADLFPETTNDELINYRTYYYTIIAYAYNDTSSDGRLFIPGNGNFKRYSAIPHKTEFENFGMTLNSAYGVGPEITQIQGRGSGGRFTKLTDETESKALSSPYVVKQPVYKSGAGPIDVKVVNAKEIKGKKYQVEVTRDKFLSRDSTQNGIDSVFADWVLYEMNGPTRQEIYSSKYVRSSNKQNYSVAYPSVLAGEDRYINQRIVNGQSIENIDHGFSVAVKQVDAPGDTMDLTMGYVGSSIEYTDRTKPWYFGLPDQDNFENFNWIRGGAACVPPKCKEDADYVNKGSIQSSGYVELEKWAQRNNRIYDPNSVYEGILNGTWAPYCMTAYFHTAKDIVGPSLKTAYEWLGNNVGETRFGEINPQSIISLDKLPNVDVVITSNPELWSRCVVVETSPTKSLGSGAHVLTAKWRKSMSKNDVVNAAGAKAEAPAAGSTDYGMSYFPGYAVNVDNGQRLNIFFGESSWHRSENGDDMLFNPTSNPGNDLKAIGGRHYIYVSNTLYDECSQIAQTLRVPIDQLVSGGTASLTPYQFGPTTGIDDVAYNIESVYNNIAYTSIGFVSSAEYLFKTYDKIPSDLRVSIRVNRPFVNDPDNGGNPIYEFDMTPFASEMKVDAEAEASLQNQMTIVPNPYYGRSGLGMGRYEKNQLDTRIKITNLPQTCDIRIFTLGGTLIRTFRKDSDLPYQDWDLKNTQGVPIASGLYIIHVDAGKYGQKVLKFFAIMPELDLNAY